MALGPGKYDSLCTYVREEAEAEAAVVIVYHGEFGNGFSVQGDFSVIAGLPKVLREVADQIDGSFGKV